MPKIFEASGESIGGIPLTATITDTRGGSGTGTLIPEGRFFSLQAGQNDHVRIEPMWAKDFTLTVVRTAPVEDLTDAAEDEVLVSVTRDDTGEEIKRGFFVPRRYEDQPFLPYDDVVSLTFDEGLPTLKSKSFGNLTASEGFQTRIIDVIREILNGLYNNPLPLEVGMRWWPKSSALTSSDLPLRYTWINPDNFRQDRPDGEEWLSQFEVLKDIFQAFGFVCRQVRRSGELRWHIRHDFGLNASQTIPLWLVQTDGTITSKGEVDLSVDITQKVDDGLIRREHGRTFEQGRQRVEVTHDHASDLNYVTEGGFEQVGFFWNNIAAGAGFNEHSSESRTPDGSVENRRFAKIAYDSDTGSGAVNYQLEQTFPVVLPDKESSLRLQLEQVADVQARLALELTDGTLKLGFDEARITSTLVDPGEARINTAPLPDDLYEGQQVPVFFVSGPWVFANIRTYLEVDETAEKGDTIVRGTLQDKVEADNYIAIPTFSQSPVTSFLPLMLATPSDQQTSWGQKQVEFSMTDDNGDAVEASELTIRFGFEELDQNDGVLEWLFDNVTVQPARGRNALTETASLAETDGSGEKDEITTRVGSGPSEDNIGRIFGQGFYDSRFPVVGFDNAGFITVEGDATGLTSGGNIFVRKAGINNGEFTVQGATYDSANDETEIDVIGLQLKDAGTGGFVVQGLQSRFNAFRWGVGPSATETFPLSELLARQRLRHFRQQNEVLQISPVLSDDPLFFYGHQVPVIDGTAYTISEAQATPTEAGRPFTLLKHKDYGTA